MKSSVGKCQLPIQILFLVIYLIAIIKVTATKKSSSNDNNLNNNINVDLDDEIIELERKSPESLLLDDEYFLQVILEEVDREEEIQKSRIVFLQENDKNGVSRIKAFLAEQANGSFDEFDPLYELPQVWLHENKEGFQEDKEKKLPELLHKFNSLNLYTDTPKLNNWDVTSLIGLGNKLDALRIEQDEGDYTNVPKIEVICDEVEDQTLSKEAPEVDPLNSLQALSKKDQTSLLTKTWLHNDNQKETCNDY